MVHPIMKVKTEIAKKMCIDNLHLNIKIKILIKIFNIEFIFLSYGHVIMFFY